MRARSPAAIAGLAAVALLLATACPTDAVARPAEAPAAPPALEAGTDLSDTGHFRLSWKAGVAGTRSQAALPEYELQESRTADFAGARTLYRGPDQASVISGRTDGDYWYRLRRDGGPWSEPAHVRVRHHSLGEALLFLGLGAAVFLATAVLVTAGHRAHRKERRTP